MSDHMGAVRAAFADVDLDLNNPAHAFAYGVAMGQAIERERQELADDAIHRAAVQAIARDIQRADRRAHADRPGPRPADYQGRAA